MDIATNMTANGVWLPRAVRGVGRCGTRRDSVTNQPDPASTQHAAHNRLPCMVRQAGCTLSLWDVNDFFSCCHGPVEEKEDRKIGLHGVGLCWSGGFAAQLLDQYDMSHPDHTSTHWIVYMIDCMYDWPVDGVGVTPNSYLRSTFPDLNCVLGIFQYILDLK